jgi:HD-GYP domain-containing protein (c-di-GMP phosphodiesterase class II)
LRESEGLTAMPKARRRGRILFSLLLLLFAVGPIPLLFTAHNLVTTTHESLELDQKSLQQDKARGLAQQVALYIQSLRMQVQAIAQTLAVEPRSGVFTDRIERIRNAQTLRELVDPDSPIPIYYIGIVDLSCTGVGSGIQLPEPEIDDFLHQACMSGREGDSMVSEPVLASSVREPVLVVSSPFRGTHGKVEGVVLVVAGLGPLWRMTAEMAQGGVEVYIVNRRGDLVAHSDPSRLGVQTNMSGIEIVDQFIQYGQTMSLTRAFTINSEKGPVRFLGTYASVQDEMSWGVIVQVREAEAFASVRKSRMESFWLVALVTVVAVVLGTLFAGEVSRPIRALARGAHRLAEGDYGTRVHVRSSNEVGILAEAFNQMGEEIQKAIEQIREAAAKNKELFVGSIRMLANAIDEKDPYTRGHSDRVAHYAKVTAKHLGMSEQEVERVYLSGILHDVGKIGIEDKILRKAGSLTDEEFAVMKQHPSKGEHILAAVPMLKAMTGDGLKHHENVDGTGYPQGLSGEDIPLLGRIVSVADAFDAMTTDRPYQKAMTFEAALARLRFLTGSKFDPACVGAIEKAYAAGELLPESARTRIVSDEQNETELLGEKERIEDRRAVAR